MRRGTLVVGVLGAVLAVVGFELGDPWPLDLGLILGGAGTVCTLAALWLQHREGSPFEYHVTESSWKPYSPDEFTWR